MPSTLRTTALLTALHFMVDALCACCVFMTSPLLGTLGAAVCFVLYNVLAFMTQPFVGLWIDSRNAGPRAFVGAAVLLLGGTLCTIVGLMLSGATNHVLMAAGLFLGVVLIGMGNSLFHVAGGRVVARSTQNDLRHLGVFVSSGAVGLVVGAKLGSVFGLTAIAAALLLLLWALLATEEPRTVAASAAPSAVVSAPSVVPQAHVPVASAARGVYSVPTASVSAVPLLLSLLLVVFVRSWFGKVVPASVEGFAPFAVVVSLLAFAGKAGGGFVARRFGVERTLMVLLIVAAGCFLLTAYSWLWWLAMVLLINGTMALTLHLANRLLPGREGLAFGLLAGVLFPGYLLGMFCASSALAYALLFPLVATVGIELLVLLCLRERRWTVLAASVVMNIMTNVPLNLAASRMPALQTSLPAQLVAEAVVVAAETLLFRIVTDRWSTAAKYALLCNVVSYLCGVAFSVALRMF